MKILMIGAYKPQLGGVSQVVQNIVDELKKTHKVYVMNVEKKGLPRGLGHWKDGNVEVYQEKIYFFINHTNLQTMFQTTKRALLLSKKVDLYHAHGPLYSSVGFIDKRKPLVVTFHGYPSLEDIANGRVKENSPQFKFIRWMEKKTVERADAIIAVDRRIKNWIIKDLGGSKNKVYHIPNGVDVKRFNPQINGEKIRQKYNIGDNPLIVYIKGLSIKNGPLVLIRAMAEVIKKYPNAKLLMAGAGPLKDKIVKEINLLKLKDSVIMVGPIQNEIAPYYHAASDIIVVPSVHVNDVEEATSLTMLEGMATGKPVVVSNIGGLKEVVTSSPHKEIGVLFEEGNPDDLAKKINWLLENPDKRKEIGKNAREFVKKHYTWEINAKKVLEVYNYAIENKK